MRYLIALLALLWPVTALAETGDVCLEDPAELSTTPATGVPSGTPFCYDTPGNTVCHYASGGDLFGEANAATFSWDGIHLNLNGAGTDYGISYATGTLFVRTNDVTRWRFDTSNFFAGQTTGAGALANEVSSLTNPTLIPYLSGDDDTGIGGDGADTLALIAGGLGMTWDGSSLDLKTGVAGVQGMQATGGNNLAFYSGTGILSALVEPNRIRTAAGNAPAMMNEAATLTNATLVPHYIDFTHGIGGNGAGDISVIGGTVYPPATTQALLAAGQIDPTDKYLPVAGSGGAVTLTSNPQILDGEDGQEIVLVGTSETNTLTISNGNGLRLNVSTLTLANADSVTLAYISSIGDWIMVGDAADNDGT